MVRYISEAFRGLACFRHPRHSSADRPHIVFALFPFHYDFYLPYLSGLKGDKGGRVYLPSFFRREIQVDWDRNAWVYCLASPHYRHPRRITYNPPAHAKGHDELSVTEYSHHRWRTDIAGDLIRVASASNGRQGYEGGYGIPSALIPGYSSLQV